MKKKNGIEIIIPEKEYRGELLRIRNRIEGAEAKILRQVNSEVNLTYYDIGTYINERKNWGDRYIPRLANDLKDKKGFSISNLKYMSQFASNFSREEISHQVGGQIPWRTIVEIMSKCKMKEERLWYIQKTYENRWSRSKLIKQIQLNSFRYDQPSKLVSQGIKEYNSKYIKEIAKDTYVLDFVKEKFNNEKELKDELINYILDFLEKLGNGFALIAREHKLLTKSNNIFKIDLLMYHTKIHAYIVIEVKVGKYHPENLGQLKKYVTLVDEIERDIEVDKPTIGLLFCQEVDDVIVKTYLDKELSPLAVSRYIALDDLKKFIKNKKEEL